MRLSGRALLASSAYAAVKRREVNAGVCAPVHSNITTVTAKTAR